MFTACDFVCYTHNHLLAHVHACSVDGIVRLRLRMDAPAVTYVLTVMDASNVMDTMDATCAMTLLQPPSAPVAPLATSASDTSELSVGLSRRTSP